MSYAMVFSSHIKLYVNVYVDCGVRGTCLDATMPRTKRKDTNLFLPMIEFVFRIRIHFSLSGWKSLHKIKHDGAKQQKENENK